VKGWHNDVVRKSNIEKKWKTKEYDKLKMEEQTITAGKNFLGNGEFKKILVLSCIEEANYNDLKKDLEVKLGYDEVLDFPKILNELIEGNKEKDIEKFNQFKNYRDSEFLQILRFFIKYYLKKKEKREKISV